MAETPADGDANTNFSGVSGASGVSASLAPSNSGPLDDDHTDDAFFDGAVSLRQRRDGYRVSLDTLLLGAAIRGPVGGRAVELGCGAGGALLAAAHWNAGLSFQGLERDPALADLARHNAAQNGCEARVTIARADITDSATWLRDSADVVFFNPPFLEAPRQGRLPQDARRRAAFVSADGEGGGLDRWVEAGLAMVKTRGWLIAIHRADRLSDLITALNGRAGGLRILSVYTRAQEDATRVILAARKGARTPDTLLAPLVLRDASGASTPTAQAIDAGAARTPLWPSL